MKILVFGVLVVALISCSAALYTEKTAVSGRIGKSASEIVVADTTHSSYETQK